MMNWFVHDEPGYVGAVERQEAAIAQYEKKNREFIKNHAKSCAVCRRRNAQ